MSKYDPHWLQKEKAKQINSDLRRLTHADSGDGRNGTYCGKYIFTGTVLIVQFPDKHNLPSCWACRKGVLNFYGDVYECPRCKWMGNLEDLKIESVGTQDQTVCCCPECGEHKLIEL